MGDKFLPTATLLTRLDVLVGWLADPWYRTCYGWGRQLLGYRRPCGGTTGPDIGQVMTGRLVMIGRF